MSKSINMQVSSRFDQLFSEYLKQHGEVNTDDACRWAWGELARSHPDLMTAHHAYRDDVWMRQQVKIKLDKTSFNAEQLTLDHLETDAPIMRAGEGRTVEISQSFYHAWQFGQRTRIKHLKDVTDSLAEYTNSFDAAIERGLSEQTSFGDGLKRELE